jgi:hypothetical protein
MSAGGSHVNLARDMSDFTLQELNARFDVPARRRENGRGIEEEVQPLVSAGDRRPSRTRDGRKVTLYCGDSNSGYVHIRERHQRDWQAPVNDMGGGNWDDFAEFAIQMSLEHPAAGYPKNIGGNKRCYSTPITMLKNDGTAYKTLNPSVIASYNNQLVITAFPTVAGANCNVS